MFQDKCHWRDISTTFTGRESHTQLRKTLLFKFKFIYTKTLIKKTSIWLSIFLLIHCIFFRKLRNLRYQMDHRLNVRKTPPAICFFNWTTIVPVAGNPLYYSHIIRLKGEGGPSFWTCFQSQLCFTQQGFIQIKELNMLEVISYGRILHFWRNNI